MPTPKVNVLIPSCDTGIDLFNQGRGDQCLCHRPNMVFLNSVEGVNVSARKPSCQQRRLDQDIINKMGKLFVVKWISSDQ